jgi:hypothetical protein
MFAICCIFTIFLRALDTAAARQCAAAQSFARTLRLSSQTHHKRTRMTLAHVNPGGEHRVEGPALATMLGVMRCVVH